MTHQSAHCNIQFKPHKQRTATHILFLQRTLPAIIGVRDSRCTANDATTLQSATGHIKISTFEYTYTMHAYTKRCVARCISLFLPQTSRSCTHRISEQAREIGRAHV